MADLPDLKEVFFSDQLGNTKKDEDYATAATTWENFKFFKH
jgi:hypothetical protein